MERNQDFIAALEAIVDDRLKFDVPLAKLTHYKIGGPASYMVEAKTTEEIVAVIAVAKQYEIPFVVLGGGTNVLASDAGFEGLVIKMANRSVQVDEESGRVVVEAGMLSSALARKTVDHGLTGFEWAISLPGTIGGAVRGNAGCFGSDTKANLVSAEVLHVETGEVKELTTTELNMGYRESRVKHEPLIVLRATFEFEKTDVERAKETMESVLRCRLESQPKNEKCAGCAFKNVEFSVEGDIEKLRDVVGENFPVKFLETKQIPAGWLIDQADLKGTKIGGAAVSDVHGNFITNDGTATADDIAQLIALIKTRVRDQFGVQLHEEIQYIGF